METRNENELVVKKLLIEYFNKRFEWESNAYNEMQRLEEKGEDSFKVFKDYKPLLEEIYSTFLTAKERKQTLAYNSIGSQPMYDPKFESISEVTSKSKSKIIIRTVMERGSSKLENEYVFFRKEDSWKLDNKKTFWNFKQKWESTIL